MTQRTRFSRRTLLSGFGAAGLITGGAAVWSSRQSDPVSTTHAHSTQRQSSRPPQSEHNQHGLTANMVQGDVDPAVNGFDPMKILTDFDTGTVSKLADGRTLREYRIYASNKTIEIAPGVTFPAWVYNGRVPGPTLRCAQGDRVRVIFVNGSDHPHSIHFHRGHWDRSPHRTEATCLLALCHTCGFGWPSSSTWRLDWWLRL